MQEPLSDATFRQWIVEYEWTIRRFEASGAFPIQEGNCHNAIGNICLTYAPKEAPLAFMHALRVWRQRPEPNNLVVAVLWKLGKTDEMSAECEGVLAAYADLAELPGNDLTSNGRVSASPIGARNQLVAANAFLGRWHAAAGELDRYIETIERLWPGRPNPHEEGFRRAILALADEDPSELSVGLTAMQPRVGVWPSIEGTLDAELFRFMVCKGDRAKLEKRHREREPWRGVA